ncbi:MAG: HD domain-containing protein [Parcubacteria group bacterium]|nr:HD domain-containing protein [Parcubacteria group bacterium]
MIYNDKVYGEQLISEPVVLELIQSKAIQRLKGIDQGGYRPLWVKPETKVGQYEHTRFAHSIGVYILLKKYKASVEEQLAGLLHDVAHTTFSHCGDYAIGSDSEHHQNHHDLIFQEFIKKSEVPAILERHNLNTEYILNENNFPLLEKDLPNLSADRIDYSLRTAAIFDGLTRENIDYFLSNLAVKDDCWIFNDFESAKKYAELFLRMNIVYYSDFSSAVMFRAVGDYLKYAFEKGYILEKDFYTTDNEVIDKTNQYINQDFKLKKFFERMNNKELSFPATQDNCDSVVWCKSRVVDPLFMDGTEIKGLSDMDEKWKHTLEKELKPKQHFIKFKD